MTTTNPRTAYAESPREMGEVDGYQSACDAEVLESQQEHPRALERIDQDSREASSWDSALIHALGSARGRAPLGTPVPVRGQSDDGRRLLRL